MLLLVAITISVLLLKVNASTPNFIFIITDDQSSWMNSTEVVMPNTMKYIHDHGMNFKNAFVATPICCPSRTETISGRYLQNIQSKNLSLNTCMDVNAKGNVFNKSSMFQILQKNGYQTGIFGKMTNDQNEYWCTPIENNYSTPLLLSGFDRINCPCQMAYYAKQYMDKYNNGTYKLHNIQQSPSNYLTSYIGNQSVNWIKSILADNDPKPFFAWIGIHAPHDDANPAAWYADLLSNLTAPRTPNFGVDSPEKVSWIAENPAFNSNITRFIDQLYKDRMRTLISADDLVNELFEVLSMNTSVLNNTYVIFTSDHGFHMGQWRIPYTKHLPYDTDIRVPLFMRGPGMKHGVETDNIVSNIDILPTILSLAGIEYNTDSYDGMDWSSFILKIGEEKSTWNRSVTYSAYQSGSTNSNCPVWFSGVNGSVYPGQSMKTPCCNDDNQAWLLDNNDYGSWHAIRILNETDNLMYVEWIEQPFHNYTNWENPYWNELYDLNDDPYQINNLFKEIPNDKQAELHDLIMKYGTCRGNSCNV